MSTRFYEFGPFRIDTLNHVLLRNGTTLPLKPKVFDTLLVLVENRGRVLDKDELLSRLWPDTIVEESNLTQNVYLLRKVLNEETNEEAYIETMPKRGYRFVATVTEVPETNVELIIEEHSSSRLTIDQEVEANSVPDFADEVAQTIQDQAPTASRWKKQASRWKLTTGALAVFLLVFGVALSYYWITKKSKSVETAAVRSIAVLPFKPLDADVGSEHLSFGMADNLIIRLSSLRPIIVRPIGAVRKYNAPNQDPLAAGRELKVDAVLDANTQRVDDKVRVTWRVVRITDGAALWAGKVDARVDDVFALQDSVSEQVARVLVPQLSSNDRNLLAKHYTQNREAHDLYMRGRYQWYSSASDPARKERAIKFFNQAIEKDPNFALAYSALADTYMDLASDVPPAEAMPKAKEAALKALRIDDMIADSHRSLGNVKAYYEWDWSGAEEEFKRAIDLNPNSAETRRNYSQYLAVVGRYSEAIAEAKRGQDLDTSPSGILFALGGARQYDHLIEESKKIIEMEPNNPYAHLWMGTAYAEKGMHQEAIAETEKAASLSRGATIMKAQLGHAYAVAGRKAEAENILLELRALAGKRYVSPYDIALIYAGLGNKEQAFAWLEKAYQERARRLWALRVNPSWDELRSDPRFADLLRRMNLN